MLPHEICRRLRDAGYRPVIVNVGVDSYDSSTRAYEKTGFVPLTLPTDEYHGSLRFPTRWPLVA